MLAISVSSWGVLCSVSVAYIKVQIWLGWKGIYGFAAEVRHEQITLDSAAHVTGGRLLGRVGVSLCGSYPRAHLSGCKIEAVKNLLGQNPTGKQNKTAPWSLQWRIPRWDRVSTEWRSRKRRGTSRIDTRTCRPSAPELTGQCGEFSRAMATVQT